MVYRTSKQHQPSPRLSVSVVEDETLPPAGKALGTALSQVDAGGHVFSLSHSRPLSALLFHVKLKCRVTLLPSFVYYFG